MAIDREGRSWLVGFPAGEVVAAVERLQEAGAAFISLGYHFNAADFYVPAIMYVSGWDETGLHEMGVVEIKQRRVRT